MAGSYKHCVADDGSFWFDLIENMGDAHEACEDMFNIIKAANKRVARMKAARRELTEARAEIARLKAAIEQVRELAASAELIDGGVTFRELVLEAIDAEGAAL